MKCLLTIVIALFIALPGSGQIVLDQENPTTGSGLSAPVGPIFSSIADQAQTFTVGTTGVLARIGLFVRDLDNSGPLLVDVRQTVAGVPVEANTPVLFSTTIDENSIPATFSWIEIDIRDITGAYIEVAQGDELAIVVRSPSGSFSLEQTDFTSTYANGEGFLRNVTTGGSFTTYLGDVAFRTYVSPKPMLSDTEPLIFDFEAGSGDGGWSGSATWDRDFSNGAGTSNVSVRHVYAGNTNPLNYDATHILTSPKMDFTNVTKTPTFSFSWRASFGFRFGANYYRVQIDRNDGAGFVNLADAYFENNSGGWTVAKVPLPECAGLDNIRIRFLAVTGSWAAASISSYIGLDEFKIEVPSTAVSSSSPYYENFESGSLWTHTGSSWEYGAPQQSLLSEAQSGSRCWMTGLSTNFPGNSVDVLESGFLDLQAFTETPILQYRVNSALPASGTFMVEVDRLDGLGPQLLPSSQFTGSTGGWVKQTIPLAGYEGESRVHIRFVVSESIGLVSQGVAIDDVRIFVPTYPGTTTTVDDDLSMDVFVNGVDQSIANDEATLNPGAYLSIKTASPLGSLVGGNYYLIGEAFFGAPTFTQAAPDIWFSLGSTTLVLDGGAPAPFFLQIPLSPFGDVFDYTYPGSLAGLNLLVQAVVVSPASAQNGFYASTEAFLLQFN